MSVNHTFVVLAYQESEFLESCIKSVLNQSYASQVVLFTTTPNAHIKRLAKKYSLPLKTAKHTSIGGDFDAALDAVKTGLVTIAHQDDVYEAGYSQAIVSAFEAAGKHAQIIFSDYYELRNDKKVYKNKNLKIKRLLLTPLKFRSLSGHRWAKRFVLRFGDAICCPAVTFNKAAVKTPVFASTLSCNVDWLTWEKLSNQPGKFVFVNEALMGHRIHGDSETSKTLRDDRRTEEDFSIYQKFWPTPLARFFARAYKSSEKSNQL